MYGTLSRPLCLQELTICLARHNVTKVICDSVLKISSMDNMCHKCFDTGDSDCCGWGFSEASCEAEGGLSWDYRVGRSLQGDEKVLQAFQWILSHPLISFGTYKTLSKKPNIWAHPSTPPDRQEKWGWEGLASRHNQLWNPVLNPSIYSVFKSSSWS
jgi:hypothetical protein